MPTIRISDRSWERLKAWAEPLVDTADSTLDRVLDAAESYRGTRGQKEPSPVPRSRPTGHRSPKLPEEAFRGPLLEVIYERGGSARGRDLYLPMKERMKLHLTPGDFERVKSGEERWWKSVNWMRYHLVREGYLRDDSPRGVWALSEMGVALVESRLGKASKNFVDHLRAMPDAGEDTDFDRSRSSS